VFKKNPKNCKFRSLSDKYLVKILCENVDSLLRKNAVAACHELLAGSLKKSYFVFQFLCVFIEFFFNLKGHCSRSR